MKDSKSKISVDITSKESEARIQSIFRSAPIGIGVVSNRILLEVNDRFCEMTGYKESELIGQNSRIVYSSDEEFERVGKYKYEQIQKYGTGSIETQFKRKDGKIIDIFLSSTPIDLNDLSVGVTFTVLDITERKKAEKERINTKELLEIIGTTAKIGGWELDIVSNEMKFSKEAYFINDLDPSEDISIEQAFEMVHPEDRAGHQAEVENAIITGKSWDAELRMKTAKGREIWIRSQAIVEMKNSKAIRLHGIFQDITERKLAEETLRKSEKLYSDLYHETNDAIITHDLNGNILQANQKALKMFGYLSSEIKSLKIFDLHHIDELVKAKKLFKALIQGGNIRSEINFVDKNGKIFMCDLSASIIEIEGEKIIQGIVRDITERKQAEEELKENEKKFRTLVGNIPGVTYRCDYEANWTMQYLSNQIEALSGFPATDFIDNSVRTYASIIYPDDRKMVEDVVFGSVEKNKPFNMEYRIIHADGSIRWISEDGQGIFDDKNNVSFLDGVLFDITERKDTEKRLQKSERHFRELVDKSGIAILIDDIEGNFTYFNEIFTKLFGYSAEEIKKMSIQSLVHPDDLDRVLKFHKERLQGKKIPSRYEFRGVRKDASTIHLEVDAVNLKEGKNFVGTRSYLWDITDRKQAEMELQASKDYLDKIINSVASPIFVKEDNHKFYLVNDALCSLLNLPNEKVIGTTGFEYLPKDQMKVFIAKDQEVFETGKENINEELLTDGTGNIKTIVTRKTLYTDSNGKKFLVGIINDITDRKHTEEKIKENQWKLQLLSENAMKFVEFPMDKDIYHFIGQQLRKLVNKDSYIIVNSIDQDTNILSIRAVTGIGKRMGKVVKLLGKNPEEMTLTIKYENLKYLSDGLLHDSKKGIHELSFKNVPQPIASSIEKLFNIGKIYTIGFLKEKQLFSTAIIILKKDSSEIQDPEIIEAFIKQASIAIQKKQVENELAKHRDDLEKLVKERTAELEEKNVDLQRFHDATIEREFRIKDLNDEIEKLKSQLNK